MLIQRSEKWEVQWYVNKHQGIVWRWKATAVTVLKPPTQIYIKKSILKNGMLRLEG